VRALRQGKDTLDEMVDCMPEVWAVQLDLTGHGSSRKAEGGDLDDRGKNFGMDVLEVIDACRQSRRPAVTVACGHSLGGKACLWAAVFRPGVFTHLMLMEPILFPKQPSLPVEARKKVMHMYAMTIKRKPRFPSLDAARRSYQGRGVFKTWTQSSFENYLRGGFEVQPADGSAVLCCTPEWEALNFIMEDYELWGKMPWLNTPATVLVGEKSTNLDRIPGCESTQAFYRAYHEYLHQFVDSELVLVPGTTHSLPFEAPREVAQAIRDRLPAASLRG
jgi:pimeloyl-ACP methyl ester carboxylesterase